MQIVKSFSLSLSPLPSDQVESMHVESFSFSTLNRRRTYIALIGLAVTALSFYTKKSWHEPDATLVNRGIRGRTKEKRRETTINEQLLSSNKGRIESQLTARAEYKAAHTDHSVEEKEQE